MEENFSMEWNMEENFSMEWKIFGIEWKWNGRKLPVWNMEKSSSIPYHAWFLYDPHLNLNLIVGEKRLKGLCQFYNFFL